MVDSAKIEGEPVAVFPVLILFKNPLPVVDSDGMLTSVNIGSYKKIII